MNAALHVLALVAGMRPEQRLGRRFAVLQAYIDESSKGDLFVMAGYIATVENWMAFADEWASLLALGPPHFLRISEFHMNQMTSPLGLEQSEIFYRVIEKHLHVYVSCVVNIGELRRVFDETNWPDWLDNLKYLRNEYFVAFDQIVRGLALHGGKLGIDGPVDFFFDDNQNKKKCMEAWDLLKRHGHPAFRPLLGETPGFRDSAKFMPVQAADMIAYWLRDTLHRVPITDPGFKPKFPWDEKSKSMKGLGLYRTPAMTRRMFRDAILSCSLLRAGIPIWQVPSLVQPKLTP